VDVGLLKRAEEKQREDLSEVKFYLTRTWPGGVGHLQMSSKLSHGYFRMGLTLSIVASMLER